MNKNERQLVENSTVKIQNNTGGGKQMEALPDEMLEMIFGYLRGKELKCCYDTCQRFRRILENNKKDWMFEEVLPIIWKNLGISELNKEILKCRLVSKKWSAGVSHYVKNIQWAKPERDFFLEHKGDWSKGHHYTFPMQETTTRKLEEMKAHLKNPFMGLVKITVFWQCGQPIIPMVDNFVTTFGENIAHLQIQENTCELLYDNATCLISQCLQMCPNLIGLQYDLLDWKESVISIQPTIPSISPSLKFIKLCLCGKRNFTPQNEILTKCCPQLHTVRVCRWEESLYASFNWKNLVELEIGFSRSTTLLQNLAKITAPSLEKLIVPVNDACSFTALSDLIHLTNKFSRLHYLHIKFGSEFRGFTENELELSREVLNPAPVSLKHFEVTFEAKLQYCTYSFLFFFRFLKRISINAYFNFPDNSVTSEAGSSGGPRSSNSLRALFNLTKGMIERRQLHKCNIWEVCSSLEKINTSYLRGWVRKERFYTRKMYEDWKTKGKVKQ